MNKQGFYQIGFTKNQILQEQNQFSSEIPLALQNTKILCKRPMWFLKYTLVFQNTSRIKNVLEWGIQYAYHGPTHTIRSFQALNM